MEKSTFCYVIFLFTTLVFVLLSVGYLSPSWFSRSYVVKEDAPTVMADRRKLKLFDNLTHRERMRQSGPPDDSLVQYHVTVGIGLWYASVCLTGNHTDNEEWCNIYVRKDPQNLDDEMVMLEMRIEASVAVGASLLAVLASWSAICSSDTAIKKLLLTMVLLVISGICMLLPFSNALRTHTKHNDVVTNGALRPMPGEKDSHNFSAVWGLFLCGAGGVLAILTAFMIAVLSWKKSCGVREEKWYNFNHELDDVSTMKSEKDYSTEVFTVPLKNKLNNVEIVSKKEINDEKNVEMREVNIAYSQDVNEFAEFEK